jgi:hypothetical protein
MKPPSRARKGTERQLALKDQPNGHDAMFKETIPSFNDPVPYGQGPRALALKAAALGLPPPERKKYEVKQYEPLDISNENSFESSSEPVAKKQKVAAPPALSPVIALDHPMFQSDWTIVDGGSMILDLKSSIIKLGIYSGVKDLPKESAMLISGVIKFINAGGGCQECDGNEVFELSLPPASDVLKMESYVECRCGGSYGRCEETDWTATKKVLKEK